MQRVLVVAGLAFGLMIASVQAALACFTVYNGGDCSGTWTQYCSYNQDGSNCCYVAHSGRYTNSELC